MRYSSFATTVLLATVLAFGCGGSATTEAPQVNDADQPFVEVRVYERDGDEERTLERGAVLHSGDKFYLSVRAGEPVYLYLMYVGPDGQAHVLYPPDDEGDFRLEAGREIRFPPDSAIQLDDETGTEHLYVIASRDRIETLGDDTLESYRAAKAGEPLPEPPLPEPASRTSTQGAAEGGAVELAHLAMVRTRGLTVVPDDESDTHIEASPDDEGVAVVFFPIEHR